MRRSFDPMASARSRDPKPVEGNSEMDLIIKSSSLLIHIEAKLNSDIRMRTSYHPLSEPDQLMRKYREDPQTLSRDLPHRDPTLLQKVAQGLTVVTWREIAKDIRTPRASDDEQLLSIKRELWCGYRTPNEFAETLRSSFLHG
jgi:hypothetical protein